MKNVLKVYDTQHRANHEKDAFCDKFLNANNIPNVKVDRNSITVEGIIKITFISLGEPNGRDEDKFRGLLYDKVIVDEWVNISRETEYQLKSREKRK